MKVKRLLLILGVLLLSAIALHFLSANPSIVEKYYSTGFYIGLSQMLRLLDSWITFSVGDVLYTIFGLWLLIKLVKWLQLLFRKQISRRMLESGILKIFILVTSLYLLFNIFWGINYNRKGINAQLQLEVNKSYNPAELKLMNRLLVNKVNENKRKIMDKKSDSLNDRQIFNKSAETFRKIKSNYPFLDDKNIAVKSSMYGWLGNYLGFTGYYNAFTAEAQVNTTVPRFLLPYIACHEIAHQLGYAKENEANFVGYLAASSSTDETFLYSVYLDLFLYSNRNLKRMDTSAAFYYSSQLLPQVKADLKQWREFNLSHENPFGPIVRWIYDKYLQSNEQPSGIYAYDEVTAFLIAYYKKFGRL